MNIPIVFVTSLNAGEQALTMRWDVARVLNSEGILTEFNPSSISTTQTDTQHKRTPFTLIIDYYEQFILKNNMTETEHPISGHKLIPHIHKWVRLCAP